MALVPSRPNRREMPGGMWAVARCGTGPCPRGYCFGWRCLGSLLARCSARNPPGGGGARLALLVVLPGGCPGSVPWTGVAGSRREQAQSLAAPSGVCPLLRVAALLCCVYCRRVGAQGGGRGVRMEPTRSCGHLPEPWCPRRPLPALLPGCAAISLSKRVGSPSHPGSPRVAACSCSSLVGLLALGA